MNGSVESNPQQTSEEMDELWRRAVDLDLHFSFPDIKWYLYPALMFLSKDRNWRKAGRIEGVVDASFPQPAASTSSIRRIVLNDGSVRVIKELDANHSHFYTDTPTAQALTLAGEQAIAWPQFVGEDYRFQQEEQIYQGVFSLQQDRNTVILKPYELGDDGRVVGLMDEVDSRRTLGLLMFSEFSPQQDRLHEIYRDLVVRAMKMKVPMLNFIKKEFGSEQYIRARIHDHTPGQLRDGSMGKQFSWLKDEASTYIELADKALEHDGELFGYLLHENYARRGGDVRAINTILTRDDNVEVVLDQINLLLDRKAWGRKDWQFKRLDVAPWGMNSDTYEVAFLIPDLLASGNEAVAQSIVDMLGCYNSDFAGERWDDLQSTPIRVLRFWTAMKAVETAGLSTFQIDHPDLGKEERGYLSRAIEQYGDIAVKLIQELAETSL